jgi:hypothetical protein
MNGGECICYNLYSLREVIVGVMPIGGSWKNIACEGHVLWFLGVCDANEDK